MKLSFTASGSPLSIDMLCQLTLKYNNHSIEECDVIVALGGDGHILSILHSLDDANQNTPIFGINCGSLGFLLNEINEEDLIQRIKDARPQCISRMSVTLKDAHEQEFTAHAFNDVYLNRSTHQAAKLSISVNGVERISTFTGDGLILSTEMGSTAYNHSAGGPIIPLGSNLTALTPICGFSPKHWRGALLKSTDSVEISVLENSKRPVSVVADSKEFTDIVSIKVARDIDHCSVLLFDKHDTLNEKIIREQFYG